MRRLADFIYFLALIGMFVLISLVSIVAGGPVPGAVVPGETFLIGEGTARSWVATDTAGRPTAVGITLSEEALHGLPQRMTPGVHGVETLVPLPKMKDQLFDHIGLNWNPRGHMPSGVYTVPHFDVHFYLIDRDERDRIQSEGEGAKKMGLAPSSQYVPTGYVMPPGTGVSGMGAHWIDPVSHEFHGHQFTHTLIWGSYDGRFVFIEPMLTKAFLESKPQVSVPLKLPTQYERSGYYPTSYAIRYDATTRSYMVAPEGLTLRRAASPPTSTDTPLTTPR
jgi:Hypothetical protein TTHB210